MSILAQAHRSTPPVLEPGIALHKGVGFVFSSSMEAASARMASRDRFGSGFGEPAEPRSTLQRYICGT
jgi:hypothetical protein